MIIDDYRLYIYIYIIFTYPYMYTYCIYRIAHKFTHIYIYINKPTAGSVPSLKVRRAPKKMLVQKMSTFLWDNRGHFVRTFCGGWMVLLIRFSHFIHFIPRKCLDLELTRPLKGRPLTGLPWNHWIPRADEENIL